MLRNIIAILLLLAASTGVVLAGEIRVLAANAVQDPLDRFAQAFTRATGHKVDIGYSLTGPILADIKAGKPADAIVLPEQGKVALVGAGLLDKPVPVAASLAGVGVRADAPTPDVSTLEAFKALLRAARSLVARPADAASTTSRVPGTATCTCADPSAESSCARSWFVSAPR